MRYPALISGGATIEYKPGAIMQKRQGQFSYRRRRH